MDRLAAVLVAAVACCVTLAFVAVFLAAPAVGHSLSIGDGFWLAVALMLGGIALGVAVAVGFRLVGAIEQMGDEPAAGTARRPLPRRD